MAQTHLTFLEHLNELRKRILVSLAAVAAGAVGGYCYSEQALRILLRPVRAEIGQAYFFTPYEAFLIRVKTAFFLGFLVASPVIVGQLWKFLSPALFENEKKTAVGLILACSLLFFAGAAFAFFAVLPFGLNFLLSMQTEYLRPMISISSYVGFVLLMLFVFGLCFNLPVFIVGLVLLGVLGTKTLNKYQRHAVLLIFVAAAVLTPGPDIFSQVLLAVPLVALFELSVLAAFFVEAVRRRKAARREIASS